MNMQRINRIFPLKRLDHAGETDILCNDKDSLEPACAQ